MTTLYRALLLLPIAAMIVASPAFADTWAIKITTLVNDGKDVPEVKLTIIENGDSAQRSTKRGDTFPAGVVIVTPARI